MTTDERIDKLEKRVDKLEEHNHEQDMTELQKYNNLEKLIAKAVEEGIEKVMQKFETLEKRITTLENAEAQKALKTNQEIWKTVRGIIISVVVTFFATVLLNNLISIASSNVESKIKTEVRK